MCCCGGPFREKGKEPEALGAGWGSGSGSHRPLEQVRYAGRILCLWCFAGCCRPFAEADPALLYILQHRLAKADFELPQLGRDGEEGGFQWAGLGCSPLPAPQHIPQAQSP